MFDSVDELKLIGPTLAVLKEAFLWDHCVAVIDVSDKTVTIADPALGEQILTHEQFTKTWRGCGIVMSMRPGSHI